jgi:hypothetical protein
MHCLIVIDFSFCGIPAASKQSRWRQSQNTTGGDRKSVTAVPSCNGAMNFSGRSAADVASVVVHAKLDPKDLNGPGQVRS